MSHPVRKAVCYSSSREPQAQGVSSMDITSPFFVVPVLVVVFACCILFSTSSKEDGHSAH